MIRIFYLLFLSPPSPFLPVTPLLLRHFFFLSPPSSICHWPKPLPSADRLRPMPLSASDPHRRLPPASWIKVASLTSTLPLDRGCAPMSVGIGVEICVWFRRLGSWIWVWWVSAFGLLDFRGHGGDDVGGGLFYWWWVVSAWIRFVICGCGFVL